MGKKRGGGGGSDGRRKPDEKEEEVMRERGKPGEQRDTVVNIQMKREPKKGWTPTPRQPFSIMLNTGFQASVLTYAPKSRLRPFPGPQLCR